MSRFNAATAVTPWRPRAALRGPPVPKKLQCGHGSDAVETLRASLIFRASGRLQCGHGSDAVETSNERVALLVKKRLQCGHGSDAVETAVSSSPLPRGPVLQCGHGSDAVETAGGPEGGTIGHCASMRPRQ